MPYLKRINSLPLINHISYKYAQVSDIGPSWSSCFMMQSRKVLENIVRKRCDAGDPYLYPHYKEKGGVNCLSFVCPSVLPSVTNTFCHTFPSNHASQSLQTWYGALARGPTSCLLNSCWPFIYFLFPGLVHFWTLHLWMGGILRFLARPLNEKSVDG